jgi:hypothetical protein
VNQPGVCLRVVEVTDDGLLGSARQDFIVEEGEVNVFVGWNGGQKVMTISVWRKNFCSVEAISSNQKCNVTCQTDFV